MKKEKATSKVFKYLSIIFFAILAFAAKQPTFAAASSLESPLNIAWEQAYQIAAGRSQYLKGVINVISSQEPEDIYYKQHVFDLPSELEVKITQDLEDSYQIWSLFKRTLNYYQDIPDRQALLELLLDEIARISHIAYSDWFEHVIAVGTRVPESALAIGLTPSSPLGRPQFIDIVRKSGDTETYAIIPATNIATQCAYEDHLAWEKIWRVLKDQKADYSPAIDRKNVLGKGSNIVDCFFKTLQFNAVIRKILIQLGKVSPASDEATKESMRKRIYPVEDVVMRIPLAATKAPEVETKLSPAMEASVKLEEIEEASSVTAPLEPLPLVAEKLAVPTAVIAEKTHLEDALSDIALATEILPDTDMLPAHLADQVFMFPKKLNPKGERAKAREKGLKLSEVAAASDEETAPLRTFFLNAKHYRTLETILNVITTRKPPRWEDFKNMIKALGGITDDSAGNGSTECTIGTGSFSIHTTHTKGDRMYWPQIKDFAKAGLERIGITLETVKPKKK